MSLIIDELRRLLDRQLNDSGVVLWFDPERHYDSVVDELIITGATLLRFKDSFFKLRHEAESFIRGAETVRLLIYLPVDYDFAKTPLSELVCLGVTLRPGEKGLANTRLAVIARRALKGVIPESRLEKLDREVEENGLTLAELENLAARGGAATLPTAVSIVYDVQHVEDATLAFLSLPERDSDLETKNAAGELAEMLQRNYEAPLTATMQLADMRIALRRHILTTEFLSALGEESPDALKAVATPNNPNVAERCSDLARTWRNRLDLGSSYVDAAYAVEHSLHISSMSFSFRALVNVETFADTERQLLRDIANKLVPGPDAEAEEVARQRHNGFWAIQEPDLQALWELVLQAAELTRLCQKLESSLKANPDAIAIAHAYVSGEDPWFRFDSVHRHFEKKAGSLEFLLAHQLEEIDSLVVTTRQRYVQAASLLAERFVRGLVSSSFELPGLYRQSQLFERAVAPELPEKRMAYVLVDALRYELAHEFVELLSSDFEVDIEAITATAPCITEVGMAALLPHASHSLKLRASKKDRLEVAMGDAVLRNRDDRISYIEKHAGVPVVALKLEDPKQFKQKLKKISSGPGLVVVTSREIDRVGEEDLVGARQYMDDVLRHLRLALHLLAKEGIDLFVVATDHGYLFGDELAESEKIDPPGGRTVLLHRRVWVGEGGTASDSYLRTTLAKLGVQSDLEIAVPWNLTGFKAPGSESYFHGGLSPQEFLLPVLKLRPKAIGKSAGAKTISWEMKLGSTKITAAHLTVTISGQGGLFGGEWPRVRVEVRSGGEGCSVAVSGTYGFADTTGEVSLRSQAESPTRSEANSITLMLTPKAPRSGVVSIHLLDAVTGVEFMRLDAVEVSRVF